MTDDHARAEGAIDQIDIAQLAVIEFRRLKFQVDQDVEDELDALVNAMLGQPNAETNKVHSVSSATAAAKKLDQYRAKETAKVEATNKLALAEAKFLQVSLRAKLAVRLVGSEV